MIKVKFYLDDKNVESDAIIANYDESKDASEKVWTCEGDNATFENVLNSTVKIAARKVDFVISQNPDLDVVNETIKIVGNGKVINAPSPPEVEEGVIY